MPEVAALEVAAAVAVALVPVAVAVAAPCDCSAETRFWMKACMACCGVSVPEAEVLAVSAALVAPAPIAEVALASVVVLAVPAAEVAAVVDVSAPD